MGGCGSGALELRTIFSDDNLSNLVKTAENLAQEHKLADVPEILQKLCLCSNVERSEVDLPKNLLKASCHGSSGDNCLYYPSALDLKNKDLEHFQYHWASGGPVIVRDALKITSGLSWEPMVMWRAFRQIKNSNFSLNLDVLAIDCQDWSEVDVNIHRFFHGYINGQFDKNWLQLLKLKDWPPFESFDEHLRRHGFEFIKSVPFKEYTHPLHGILNLAAKLPKEVSKPDLGPKTYIAYGVEN